MPRGLENLTQREPSVVRRRAARDDGFERAAEFGGGDLAGDIVPLDVQREAALVQVDRGDGSDPCAQIVVRDGDFTEQIAGGLAQ